MEARKTKRLNSPAFTMALNYLIAIKASTSSPFVRTIAQDAAPTFNGLVKSRHSGESRSPGNL